MAWRIWADKWPNGREFWTVEDREGHRARIGNNGGYSKFYDRTEAEAEAKWLRDKDAGAALTPDQLIGALARYADDQPHKAPPLRSKTQVKVWRGLLEHEFISVASVMNDTDMITAKGLEFLNDQSPAQAKPAS